MGGMEGGREEWKEGRREGGRGLEWSQIQTNSPSLPHSLPPSSSYSSF